MIAEAMTRRLDVDVARQKRVAMDEHAFPRHFDLVADEHAVGFVVPVGERGIEFPLAAECERLARPQLQTRRVARNGAGDRLLLLVRRQRNDVADPDFVGERGAGRQHFHAGNNDAGIVLAHDLQRRHRNILPLIKFRVARGLRGHHRIDDVEVVVADVAVIGSRLSAYPCGAFSSSGFIAIPVTKEAT